MLDLGEGLLTTLTTELLTRFATSPNRSWSRGGSGALRFRLERSVRRCLASSARRVLRSWTPRAAIGEVSERVLSSSRAAWTSRRLLITSSEGSEVEDWKMSRMRVVEAAMAWYAQVQTCCEA